MHHLVIVLLKRIVVGVDVEGTFVRRDAERVRLLELSQDCRFLNEIADASEHDCLSFRSLQNLEDVD